MQDETADGATVLQENSALPVRKQCRFCLVVSGTGVGGRECQSKATRGVVRMRSVLARPMEQERPIDVYHTL